MESSSFIDTLLELGIIAKSQLESAISYQWEKGGKLEESLVRLGLFNEDTLFTFLSRKFDYYAVDLKDLKIDAETLKLIPYWIAKRFSIIPVKQVNTTLAVVMMNPLDREAMTQLKKATYFDVVPFIAKKSEIEAFVRTNYTSDAVDKEIEKVTPTPARLSEVPPFLKKYTFDSFITGKCNDFAYSAAIGAARSYSEDTNPLFIYSEVGLGKTHLLVAIWNYILEHEQPRQVIFSSSEKFITAIQEAIEAHRIKEFRAQYSNMDVLLIDDIGLIAGDEVSQQHLFHIFNDLFQNGKQIVVSSDRPPKELPTLSARLRSRFEGGLIVRVDLPDLETRIAILKFKAKEINIPDEITHLVAERVSGSVRELEGVLKEIIAFSKYKKEPPSMITVEEMLLRRSIIRPYHG